MSILTTVLILIVAIVVIGIVAAIMSKNSLNTSLNQVEEAYSTMDVYLKERHDLIPNLVNIAKGYAKHETEALQQIAQASNVAAQAHSMNQVIQDEEKVNQATNRLIAIAQAYPDLKANTNFTTLMNQLKSVEENIANARKYYNACVRQYNNKLTTFPSSLFAGNMTKKPYFQVSSESDRENVNINF